MSQPRSSKQKCFIRTKKSQLCSDCLTHFPAVAIGLTGQKFLIRSNLFQAVSNQFSHTQSSVSTNCIFFSHAVWQGIWEVHNFESKSKWDGWSFALLESLSLFNSRKTICTNGLKKKSIQEHALAAGTRALIACRCVPSRYCSKSCKNCS